MHVRLICAIKFWLLTYLLTYLVDNIPELRCSITEVYDSDRQALSTALFRRTGLLATADTC